MHIFLRSRVPAKGPAACTPRFRRGPGLQEHEALALLLSRRNSDTEGTASDNTRHPRFVAATERFFNRKVKHRDLGCAGGGLVWDFLINGNASYGVWQLRSAEPQSTGLPSAGERLRNR